MTETARQVLRDCEAALVDLQPPPTGLQWRTRWAAAVALLRSVGYILKHADGDPHKADPKMVAAINEAYGPLMKMKPPDGPWLSTHPHAEDPDAKMFWGFINRERQSILKQSYEFGARQNVTLHMDGIPAPVTYNHVMHDGPFAGQDPREVIKQAIEWWRAYLDDVDRRAGMATQVARQ